MASILVKDLCLSYPVIMEAGSLRQIFMDILSAGLLKPNKRESIVVVSALKGISFSAESGDRIGLVGANGAGKSTLLKVLSKIYVPSSGIVELNGKLESLLDMGLGVDMEETGWSNILFDLEMRGLEEPELSLVAKDVADFTELGKFLDLPMRTYSGGMVTRLSFALATARKPQILLIDEGIGAGDAQFQRKADQRLSEFTQKCDIMIVASHSDELIKSWCNRALWIADGQLKADGPPLDVIKQYRSSFNPAQET